eukprot:1129476-Rhodomonas_salina.1
MTSLLMMTIVAFIVLTFVGPAAGSNIMPTVDSAMAQLGFFNSTALALQAFGISNATTDTYFINSG